MNRRGNLAMLLSDLWIGYVPSGPGTKVDRRLAGFYLALAAVFLGLKAVGWAEYSWWWATMPIWGLVPLGLAAAALILFVAFCLGLADTGDHHGA